MSPLKTIVAAALLAALNGAQAMTPAELFAAVSPSVWRVRTYDKEGLPLAIGSAVVVGPDQLVTNCHVLRRAARFVIGRDKNNVPGTLEMWDTARDLCQVRAAIGNVPAVKLADSSTLAVGQNVYALGNPEGLELTLSAGLLSSLRRDSAERLTMIQTSAPISPGSSGGGLFDEQGRLIGLTTLIAAAPKAQNLNFALPADWIRELPQRHAELRRAAKPGEASSSAASAPAASPVTGVSSTPVVTP